MAEKHDETAKSQQPRRDRWLLVIIFILFLLGVGIRSYGYLRAPGSGSSALQPRTSKNYAQKALPESQSGARSLQYQSRNEEEQGMLFDLAPYLTEGGLSFFLGFCIGYALRLVAKIAILITGALYCCMILLSHYGIITVDWGHLQHILQQILLNTQPHIQSLQEAALASLPSVTLGGVGIWRGLKRL